METSDAITEQRNIASADLDRMSTEEIVRLINSEDKKVADAVERAIPDIVRAIEVIAGRLRNGGRLLYVGAGTSGRLGILDASECPPTYGTPPELVQGIIAGGPDAAFLSQEGAEADAEAGGAARADRPRSALDAVVGLTASGRTPFVIGALDYARQAGAATVAITCNPNAEVLAHADNPIVLVVGPEVVTGSTRMKAGTAQKMTLNIISTTTMVKLGRVASNLMVDMKTWSEKLVARAKRVISLRTHADLAEAERALVAAEGDVKVAIVMLARGISADEARSRLRAADGRLKDALEGGAGGQASCERQRR
ncbi:MAG: N-acetylmuramic acid 6-phosphate etherase [Armatimonadota bacterium]